MEPLEERRLLAAAWDFGDAPDNLDTPDGYRTLLINDGARHDQTANSPILGSVIDFETDGQPAPGADGDDVNGVPDDEDGVTFITPLVPGQPAKVEVIASMTAYLDAWIDFDFDGKWATASDRIFNAQPLVAGANVLTFTVPADAQPDAGTYSRFRIGEEGGLPYFGPAIGGEVEDYLVQIKHVPPEEWDFGDAPDEPNMVDGYRTLLANNGARHDQTANSPILGSAIDFEPDGQPAPGADGDDVNPSTPDDEDGVTFITPLVPGQSAQVEVIASMTAYLDAWIDFDFDGKWTTASDRIFNAQPLVAGANVLTFTVPADARPDAGTYSRFRIGEEGGLSYFGLASGGEVEDYLVQIENVPPEGWDFGDAPDLPDLPGGYHTLLANDGARHLRTANGPILGSVIDSEADGQPSAGADEDDSSGVPDDEDGVRFLTPLVPNSVAQVEVTVSQDAKLDAWIDFDGNGNWNTVGDRIFASTAIVAGTQTLAFNVPGTAVPGATYARFRVSTGGGLSFMGAASDGEVEDYVAIINTVETDYFPEAEVDFVLTYGGEIQEPVTLTGPVTIHVYFEGAEGDAQDDDGNGRDEVRTEIVAMNLSGASSLGPIQVTLRTDVRSFGQIEEQVNAQIGLLDLAPFNGPAFTADSFFDVFTEITIDDGSGPIVLRPEIDPTVEGVITYKPAGEGDALVDPRTYQLWDPAGEPVGFSIGNVRLIPRPRPKLDFGDAPSDGDLLMYPTVLADNGARHLRSANGPILGSVIDFEPDGLPSPGADGDDVNPATLDDEDGVIFITPLVPGQPAQVEVIASMDARLDAWIDFESDGNWIAAGDQIFAVEPLVAGVNVLTFTVPAGARPGVTTYSRFRISESGGLSYEGPAENGEVEDYTVVLVQNDPPVADPNGPYVIDEGQDLILDGTGSWDPDAFAGDSIVDYQWDLTGDGTFDAIGATPTVPWTDLAALPGLAYPADPNTGLPTNTIRLQVTDSFGETDVATTTLTIFRNEPMVKWEQPPIPGPNDTYLGWDEYSVYGGDQIVADDWVSTADQPVTDVHWWGSFLGWNDPTLPSQEMPKAFHVGIWTDVPADASDPAPFSRPGKLLWESFATAYSVEFAGWESDPRNPTAPPEAMFYFEYDLPEEEWFWPGSEENIYWVSIAANYGTVDEAAEVAHPFGWTTRPRDPESPAPDDAVRILQPTAPRIPSPVPDTFPVEDSVYPSANGTGFGTTPVEIVSMSLRTSDRLDNRLARTLPGPGETFQVDSFFDVFVDLSTDGGQTSQVDSFFDVFTELRITNTGETPAGDPTGTFETEILSMNLSGGSLPVGMILRESAMSASTGQLNIGSLGENGFMVDSFFDVFTELSFDGGESWTPADTKIGMPTLRKLTGPTILGGPSLVAQATFPVQDGRYQSSASVQFTSANMELVSLSLVGAGSAGGSTLPDPGETLRVDSFFDVFVTYRDLNSGEFQVDSFFDVFVAFDVTNPGSPSGDTTAQSYDTEMVALNFVGPDSSLALRLSDLLPSRGTLRVSDLGSSGGDGFQVDSFFDVFTDLSTDGGQTWAPAGGPLRMTLSVDRPGEGPVFSPAPTFPPDPDSTYQSQNGTGYAAVETEIVSMSLRSSALPGGSTLPGPGESSQSDSFFDVFMDFNTDDDESSQSDSFFDVFVDLSITNTGGASAGDPTGTYDTEILSMQLSVALPDGSTILVREAPDRASRGQTVITDSGDGSFAVDSFFDVFTELSVDGGQTWLPADSPVRVGITPNPDVYVSGNPIYWPTPEESWDMAFVLTTKDVQPPQEWDFGDAPDDQNMPIGYHTLLANDGARHPVDREGLILGQFIDPEPDGQPSLGADKDDSSGVPDDEDGVRFLSPLRPGSVSNVEIIVGGGGGGGRLNAWIDFNGDGDWEETNEKVFTDSAVVPGTNYLNVVVPTDAAVGETYARFRLNTDGGLSDRGPAEDGEVEDYRVVIENNAVEIDSFPAMFGRMDVLVSSGERNTVVLGGATTMNVYFEGPTEGNANDDDGDGLDEVRTEIVAMNLSGNSPVFGGIQVRLDPTRPSMGEMKELTNNTPGTLDVQPFTVTGMVDSFFDVFVEVEFGGSILRSDGPVQLGGRITHKPSGPGETYTNQQPVTLVDAAGNPTGIILDNIEIVPNPRYTQDFGDAPSDGDLLTYPTVLADNGASHERTANGPILGSVIDTEADGQPNFAADGDDVNPATLDDEDGVRFLTPLVPGQQAQVEVIASMDARLDAWIDFGYDGDWIAAGDQIFAVEPLAAGVNVLTFMVPAGARPGVETYSRFRISASGGLSYEGPAENGEVEDYVVKINTVEIDYFPEAEISVVLTHVDGPDETVTLTGPLTIQVYFEGAEGVAWDNDGDGLDEVQTEIVSMDLSGTSSLVGAIQVTLRTDVRSFGQIEERVNNQAGLLDLAPFATNPNFTADSFFDVFTEITVDDGSGPAVLRPEIDPTVEGIITYKPAGQGDALVDPETYRLLDPAGEPVGFSIRDVTLIPAPRPTVVVGHHIFYSESAFDLNGPAIGPADDGAIAPDKLVLAPGNTGAFANYSSYEAGINGIMIDVDGLAGVIGPSDLGFRTGNDDYPAGWVPLTVLPNIDVRPGQGDGGSDRVTLVWPDGAVRNAWLEVTVRGGPGFGTTTGLAEDNVFYFGNAVGETGNSADDALVNAADIIAIRDNPRGQANPASLDDPHDLNRDRFVNALDLILARDNAFSPLSALRLITPTMLMPSPAPSGEAQGPIFDPAGQGLGSAESLDGIMADVADRSVNDIVSSSPTLGKLFRRLGADGR